MNDERATYLMSNEERDIVRCRTCGVRFELHTPECSRHWYPVRAYLAGRCSRREELRICRERLRALGWIVRARWLDGNMSFDGSNGTSVAASPEERRRIAREDWEDIRWCNTCISFTEEPRSNGRGGRHAEFGIALEHGLRLVVVGPVEHVFHMLPEVQVFSTFDEFLGRWFPDPMVAGVGG